MRTEHPRGARGRRVRREIGRPRQVLRNRVDALSENDGAGSFEGQDGGFEPRRCRAAVDNGGNAAGFVKNVMREVAASKPSIGNASSQLAISAIADFALFTDFGQGTEAEVLARLNNVDGIFSSQLGVELNVEYTEVFDDANEPITNTLDAGDLLDDLADYRLATSSHRSRGLTHLFTGRNLATTTVGMAFTGELCDEWFGVGLTQGTHGEFVDSLIAAHELGHNFGAPHDGVPGSACADAPTTFLMSTQVNDSDEFSDCSITEMRDDIERAACVVPLPVVDLDVAPTSQPDNVLLGNALTASFDIANFGATASGRVTVDVVVPNEFTYVSSAAIGGDCTESAGNVRCEFDSVAAGSSARVIVTSRATTVGSGTFRAIVETAADVNPGNNVSTMEVGIVPAVDLAVEAPGAFQLDIDEQLDLVLAVDNRASIDATGVALVVDLDAGLRAESASWSLGACSVTNRQVECTAPTLAAGASASLDLSIRATGSGQKTVSIVVSSSEADALPADNAVAGTIAVGGGANGGAAGGGSGEGGAGSAGPWLLLLAPLLGLRRRRL